MSIKVRYFASLKEMLGKDADELEHADIQTVADVWNKANPDTEPPANMLAALNMEYVPINVSVNNEDIVAFFPPVTGGQSIWE